MMNKEQFLGSGLIEQYVLGLTNQEETRMVESFIESYPELKREIETLQEALKQYAIEESVPPPPHIKGKIMDQIDYEISALDATPSVRTETGSVGIWRWLFWIAFASILLLGFGNYLLYQQLSEEKVAKSEIQEELQILQVACASQELQKEEIEKIYAVLTHEHTQPLALKGTPYAPSSQVVVFWNTSQKSAFLNPVSLPTPPPGHQYQVWADVEGVMIDAGLVEKDNPNLQAINFIDHAESINITLEPVGGSEHPTVEKLIANVKV